MCGNVWECFGVMCMKWVVMCMQCVGLDLMCGNVWGKEE